MCRGMRRYYMHLIVATWWQLEHGMYGRKWKDGGGWEGMHPIVATSNSEKGWHACSWNMGCERINRNKRWSLSKNPFREHNAIASVYPTTCVTVWSCRPSLKHLQCHRKCKEPSGLLGYLKLNSFSSLMWFIWNTMYDKIYHLWFNHHRNKGC